MGPSYSPASTPSSHAVRPKNEWSMGWVGLGKGTPEVFERRTPPPPSLTPVHFLVPPQNNLFRRRLRKECAGWVSAPNGKLDCNLLSTPMLLQTKNSETPRAGWEQAAVRARGRSASFQTNPQQMVLNTTQKAAIWEFHHHLNQGDLILLRTIFYIASGILTGLLLNGNMFS